MSDLSETLALAHDAEPFEAFLTFANWTLPTSTSGKVRSRSGFKPPSRDRSGQPQKLIN
jgi:hypothetical protein